MNGKSGDGSKIGKGATMASPKVDSDQICKRIFDVIVDYKVLPGTHLKEDELCDTFGVGRTRIGTALSRLASNHVTNSPPIAVPSPRARPTSSRSTNRKSPTPARWTNTGCCPISS